MLKGVSETLYIPLYGRASARKYWKYNRRPYGRKDSQESGYDFDKKYPQPFPWTYIWPYGQPRSTAWSQVF